MLEATGWALSLIGLISFGDLVWERILLDGGFAYDLNSYILAGRNILGPVIEQARASAARASPNQASRGGLVAAWRGARRR